MKRLFLVIAILSVAAFPAFAGEWHTGTTNLCSDCHTMHFSMQHNWDGTTPVATTASSSNGNWLGTTGPNARLLKLPADQLCKSCHDGQTFAPDVVEANINPAPTQGRNAGAINELASATPYEPFKGHTLGSTVVPPGFNPTAAGVPVANQYVPGTQGLECISCHLQHGTVGVYRNLGPRVAAFQPTYQINTANDPLKDVWINIPTGYVANSGNAATFNPFYDSANISYNRTDPAAPAGSTTVSSNRVDTFCSSCHGDFHGGTGDVNIGGAASGIGFTDFLRHPTSRQVIGKSALGGQSSLTQFVGNPTKVKVYASDRVGFTDATPGCVSCHKAHGNQNPFGLVFLSGHSATTPNEEGGLRAGVTNTTNHGYQSLCGQCHGQASLM